MRSINRKTQGLFALLALSGLTLSGCGSSESLPSEGASEILTTTVNDGGWWCPEHGVPEAECAQCDSTLVANFKDKGDWCEEHNRPESQCFLCSPKRAERFAKLYEVKFGQKPPKPAE